MKSLPVRKDIRLQGYDYSSNGAYFVTMCVKDGHPVLWRPDVGTHSVRPLSETGNIVKTAVENIPEIYEGVFIDKFVIMPNHIHMIARIESGGRTLCVPTISRIIKQCKEYVTKQIGYSIWQTRFHDHVIRDEEEYKRIWQYIEENPVKWAEDCYFVR
ncbi:MAG: hypothetical protein FWH06_01490 [Oscillospiraceae bacterium]|nr:hypothetical protein [Oscillospiraceae bacterium]